MADHSLPTTTSTYANFASQMSARFNDLAVGLDPAVTTATNVPTNAIRWSSAVNRFQKWNGTSWGDLTSTWSFPGGVTIAAPASGNTLTLAAVGGTNPIQISDGTCTSWWFTNTTNGIGLGTQTAHALTLYTANTSRVAINATGNVTINAPASGTALTVTQAAGAAAGIFVTAASGNGSSVALDQNGVVSWTLLNAATTGTFGIWSGGTQKLGISTAGNVTINAPTSGTALALTGAAAALVINATNSGAGSQIQFGNGSGQGYLYGNGGSIDFMSGNTAWPIRFGFGSTTMSTELARLTANGNLLLNTTTDYAWASTIKALHIGTVASFAGETTGSAIMSDNAYFDGTNWKYMTANKASQIYLGIDGRQVFRVAATGAAAGTITWTQMLQLLYGAGATFTTGVATTPVAVTFSATAMALDASLSNVFTTTFTANVTTAPTISNPIDGQTINWFITQDATGSRTMTWPTSFKWSNGSAGVLSTTANSVDVLVATYRSATGFWYCALQKAFA